MKCIYCLDIGYFQKNSYEGNYIVSCVCKVGA